MLLMGLVGLCLGWGANQLMVWALEKQSEQWTGSSALAKFLPSPATPQPEASVEFAPGIVQEQEFPAEEWVDDSALRADERADAPAPAAAPASREASPKAARAPNGAAKKSSKDPAAPASKPSVPTRGFTANREALRTQFKKASDLYAHGHYLPNEENGVRRGLRFARVAPGGVFASLGFREGDIVLSVNGAPLNSQGDVLANFEKMRKMDVLNFRLERDGKPLKHRYILK
ncbi:hypothetical protein DN745_02115 [Bradymonas sediminis]|uniref:PDZ domain-containing protein n=1 Tax=Bradymonas sediminis TaxID=1548548 RepID=A0A2Z4FHG5_9DELT|nr:hypothetical protein DN745_02115 [Bradymonas sediminis]